MISRAAFAEKSLKQIKAKNELTFSKDTSHQNIFKRFIIQLFLFTRLHFCHFGECVEISYA